MAVGTVAVVEQGIKSGMAVGTVAVVAAEEEVEVSEVFDKGWGRGVLVEVSRILLRGIHSLTISMTRKILGRLWMFPFS